MFKNDLMSNCSAHSKVLHSLMMLKHIQDNVCLCIQILFEIAVANKSLAHRLTAAVIANINTNFLLDLSLLITAAL